MRAHDTSFVDGDDQVADEQDGRDFLIVRADPPHHADTLPAHQLAANAGERQVALGLHCGDFVFQRRGHERHGQFLGVVYHEASPGAHR